LVKLTAEWQSLLNFKGQLIGPAWKDFKKAPESKPWR